MASTQPIIQSVTLPEAVNINQQFTVSITVTEAEMIVTFYFGELKAGEVD